MTTGKRGTTVQTFRRIASLSWKLALLSILLVITNDTTLKLSTELARTIGVVAGAYLLLYAIIGILVSAALDSADRDQRHDDALAAARQAAEARTEGPPSLFTPEEWAEIATTPRGEAFAGSPEGRMLLEARLRADPAELQDMKRSLGQTRAHREAAFSPMAKQWIIRIAIGLVVGLIVIANQR